ncbi:hypothetical protein AVEN_89271-1 [Araneus ventricosus]|uniref:Uncharacterized protein n=1 Tax=Araneus ventricosus TaxID=182803 RepID=A0A4Y2VA56_ARAVE|nr:hypothetical protein AVEN_89271-1 [Araneus ventricosus]
MGRPTAKLKQRTAPCGRTGCWIELVLLGIERINGEFPPLLNACWPTLCCVHRCGLLSLKVLQKGNLHQYIGPKPDCYLVYLGDPRSLNRKKMPQFPYIMNSLFMNLTRYARLSGIGTITVSL